MVVKASQAPLFGRVCLRWLGLGSWAPGGLHLPLLRLSPVPESGWSAASLAWPSGFPGVVLFPQLSLLSVGVFVRPHFSMIFQSFVALVSLFHHFLHGIVLRLRVILYGWLQVGKFSLHVSWLFDSVFRVTGGSSPLTLSVSHASSVVPYRCVGWAGALVSLSRMLFTIFEGHFLFSVCLWSRLGFLCFPSSLSGLMAFRDSRADSC